MQVIYLDEPFNRKIVYPGPIVLALGFFDGVHLGHQRVIKRAKQEAEKKGAKLAVMTLDRHPSVAFQGVSQSSIRYLTPLKRKLELFVSLGADITYVVALNKEIVPMGPQEFVDKYMVGLNAITVVAGEDYTYGKKDIANMETLAEYSKKRFEIITVPHLKKDGHKVGSTAIREYIDEGDLNSANYLLGYTYQTSGTVVHGKQRGRKLGFPTINLDIPDNERIPGEGIYAVEVMIVGKKVFGMASIGRNETFGKGQKQTVEINLFDFSKMVYGEKVTVAWYCKLREQHKYPDATSLISQLKKDEHNTKEYFKKV
ncbi:riboflavin kinase [Liquorilactobacillus sucicola DSM 21376 = JCM 15457]|uniref:Riboflavin biosynthesis protein n=1 Tax=Liquorilactobacillus sucicola DSM 21376 = JCM 15457 TaxID=1423806 RepID=A0A023CV80_9LACO|nr:riboflavin biosynthesis protein RibF [Liquorilactobacillus sucicola]KRN05383.1 bifunctional riboflavin kinase FMN adenylyltransferase [Liquorilactobacillus sucicola DSM 21376 = JCM 15457]GAJ25455.1 riboflavin kinase [Liquorilactobacillus sucicola DSM 21376 = JCM 15457]